MIFQLHQIMPTANCPSRVDGLTTFLCPHVADIVEEVFAQKAKDNSEAGAMKHTVAVLCLVDFISQRVSRNETCRHNVKSYERLPNCTIS